jgi:prolyl oligopeptidase
VLAAAEHLIDRGYTTAAQLGLEGTSAGGLTAAGAMLRRPAGFGAVVLRVPVTNTLRLETEDNGPPNIPEYGTVTSETGLRALLISDACHRLDPTGGYPPTLATAGLRDPRVTPWQPAKFIAHLQAAANPGYPTMLRVEEHAGHGVGSTKEQLDRETADRYTFFWHCLAVPDDGQR